MTLYHVTPARNQDSIGRRGLLPERATGREKAVWMVTKSMIWWAILHVARKHGRGSIIDKLIVYKCEVPRNKLRRFSKGTWRSYEAVWPVSGLPAAAYAMSYPDRQPE